MRYLRYSVLIVAALFWAGGLSSTVGHWLYAAGLVSDDYRYGDLYRIAPLPQFKTPRVNCPPANRASDTARTDLYLIGDSFSEAERLGRSDFRVRHYQRIKWDFPQRARLDTAQRNVLLIETVERHFRDHFERPINELTIVADTSQTYRKPVLQTLSEEFHRSDVEERLESLLFSNDWAFAFKELKASLTERWFDRYSTGVGVSRDRKHIFLASDTDTTRRQSSYSTLPDSEVTALVARVNAVAEHYKQQGFDAVYLSIIPNKATILEPNRGVYNHLIERVQQHPALRVPVIDIYSRYRAASQPTYERGDTHWTCFGRSEWLDEVRRVMQL